jgi:DNA polymerase V
MTFVLIDGNSFYCSCERLFQPKLARRPVIVLSNNDGCAVARTAEAKALDIKMGAPYFQIRDLCERERVAVFSSNYALYGDISRRMNDVYRTVSPNVEAYSIDETFLDLSGFDPSRHEDMARALRAKIRRWIGVPTCVGLGPTKVLAKVANKIAKGDPAIDGVCDLRDPVARKLLLTDFPVADVWGVGPASTAKLLAINVQTAADLSAMDLRLAKSLLSVVGERIVMELSGVSCMPLGSIPPTRKGLAVTRSFGERITTLDSMLEAVSTFAARAGEKLRRYELAAGYMTLFMHTSRFASRPSYSASKGFEFSPPTNDSRKLITVAQNLARQVGREGFAFSKAGVMFDDIIPQGDVAPGLFDAPDDAERNARLMTALNHQPALGPKCSDHWRHGPSTRVDAEVSAEIAEFHNKARRFAVVLSRSLTVELRRSEKRALSSRATRRRRRKTLGVLDGSLFSFECQRPMGRN